MALAAWLLNPREFDNERYQAAEEDASPCAPHGGLELKQGNIGPDLSDVVLPETLNFLHNVVKAIA
jgi:hypothetical protein